MSEVLRIAVIDALTALIEKRYDAPVLEGVWRRSVGMCIVLDEVHCETGVDIGVFGFDLSAVIKTWPGYNGDELYPVRDPSDPERDFHAVYTSTYDLWGDHPYGDSRRDLCKHVLSEIKQFGLGIII